MPVAFSTNGDKTTLVMIATDENNSTDWVGRLTPAELIRALEVAIETNLFDPGQLGDITGLSIQACRKMQTRYPEQF